MKGKHVTPPHYKVANVHQSKVFLLKLGEVNILILMVTITSTFEVIPKVDVNEILKLTFHLEVKFSSKFLGEKEKLWIYKVNENEKKWKKKKSGISIHIWSY